MPTFQTKRVVNHKAADMFALVMDVEKYPQFVPLCQALHIRGRKERENGDEVLVADMTVAYKLIKETFTTKVTASAQDSEILVEYLDGPVSELENRWSFKDLEGGQSEISFHLDYEFKSKTFATLVGAIFDRAFRKFAEAFEKRADEVYGRT